MELLVLSDYGSIENLKKENPSESDIIETMNSIDWNLFHQVCLSKNDYDWIEVGGNLKEDGLSAMYEKNNEQFVIDKAPTSINQLTEILLSYFNNDGKFNKKYKFTGENSNSDSTYDAEKGYKQLFENDRIASFEKNKTVKYELLEIIELFIFAPYYFIRGSYKFRSFKHLKDENYSLKLKQKTIIYLLSFLAWFLFISYQINNYKQKRLEEIEKVDISDWKKKHGYE
ncbi:hypothetical protein [Zhouia amylolytica]|uniref:hypothetical protein n=1 Tax=Zhouia amylolytica TaxID=376730 RepID=UPI0020CFD3B0|nr:hypothetical protein [Zhouia amylolytica]MCQ0111221.1 hypothetical protein [Zhouia amylolytica]